MTRRSRIVERRTPASWVIANGISRHGRHCACSICLAVYAVPLTAEIEAELTGGAL